MPALPWKSYQTAEPEREYLVMASLLPLRSFRQTTRFLRLTLAVRRQLDRTPGLIGYSLQAEITRKRYWTLSAWTDEAAPGQFARSMPHLDVMRALRPHMGRTVFVAWRVRGADLPIIWPEARRRIQQAAETQPRPAQ